MSEFLIVSKVDHLTEYEQISKEYQVGFEYNDYYHSDVLDSEEKTRSLISEYSRYDQPDFCTMHGAFLDIIVFSEDKAIQTIAKKRMRQSMDIARRIGAKGVVFHTNVNSFLSAEVYLNEVITKTVDYLSVLLKEYSDINIYMENMFDDNPYVLEEISKELVEFDNYGVCLDYAHASISSTPIIEWIAALHPYVRHIHINDNDLKNDLHLAIGDGEIDWQQFKEFYNQYFLECSILIETTLPKNQIRSIKYLQQLGIMNENQEDRCNG